MSHPFAQEFAAASADEAEFGPIICDQCEKHFADEMDLHEKNGQFVCDTCDPFEPKTLTDVATRKFGLREDGARL